MSRRDAGIAGRFAPAGCISYPQAGAATSARAADASVKICSRVREPVSFRARLTPADSTADTPSASDSHSPNDSKSIDGIDDSCAYSSSSSVDRCSKASSAAWICPATRVSSPAPSASTRTRRNTSRTDCTTFLSRPGFNFGCQAIPSGPTLTSGGSRPRSIANLSQPLGAGVAGISSCPLGQV